MRPAGGHVSKPFFASLAIATCAVVGCGDEFTLPGTGGIQETTSTVPTGGTSTVTTVAGSGGTSASGGTTQTITEGGAGATGGTGGSTLTVFHVTCAGTVECPGAGPCADWQYEDTDDGTTTIVKASVTTIPEGVTCSDQVQYASQQDMGQQVSGNIMFPCGFQTWAFGIDRLTQLVYVKEMTMAYSWTPPCQ